MKALKLLFLTSLVIISGMLNAQTVKKMTVEDGGTGAYKAVIVSDAKLPAFTIFRPEMLPSTPLPVVLYENGACMNSSVEARYFLNELASHGYIIVAIGPYNEDDFIAHWTEVMHMMHPGTKQVVLADGTEVKPFTEEEIKDFLAKRNESDDDTPEPSRLPTYPGQLLEALDWLTVQNNDGKSEYCGHIDLDHVAVMGQSCGGAQALAVIKDPRISTGIILNSGIGASVKHFAANNQETNRNAVNSVVSQRALRELYLKSFEIAVKEAEPWAVMTSYNGLNGEWTSESRELLEDVLCGDWGFKGMVMTDWGGGVHPVQQMQAGNNLLEPGSEEAAQEIIDAVRSGKLDEKILDQNVHRVLELVVKSFSYKNYPFTNRPDLASFNAAKSAWETDKGTYTFHVAANVSDVKASLSAKVAKPWSSKVRNVLKPQIAINELKNK